jgi:hypothetical protein
MSQRIRRKGRKGLFQRGKEGKPRPEGHFLPRASSDLSSFLAQGLEAIMGIKVRETNREARREKVTVRA